MGFNFSETLVCLRAGATASRPSQDPIALRYRREGTRTTARFVQVRQNGLREDDYVPTPEAILAEDWTVTFEATPAAPVQVRDDFGVGTPAPQFGEQPSV